MGEASCAVLGDESWPGRARGAAETRQKPAVRLAAFHRRSHYGSLGVPYIAAIAGDWKPCAICSPRFISSA